MTDWPVATALAAILAVASAVMAATWAVAVRIRNAGIVDAAWALLFTPAALLAATLIPGETDRKLAVVAVAAAWSLRLGIHLARRIAREHPAEDGRYADLRAAWRAEGRCENAALFRFFQLQALSIPILSLPFVLAVGNPHTPFSPLELAGIALAVAGFVGEGAADRQLRAFRADSTPGSVCDRGLWRYSRHPNYFFEAVTWLGFGLLGAASPGGWPALLAPLVITWLLVRVTGIPPAEERGLRLKGDRYRDYQRRTSAFIPWFPRAV